MLCSVRNGSVLLICIWVLFHHDVAYQDADYGELCPYSNLCQKKSISTIPSGESMWPCCADCSCADNCHMFKRCCPDKTRLMPNGTNYSFVDTNKESSFSCQPQQYLYNRFFKTNKIYRSTYYHVINNCPELPSNISQRETAYNCLDGKGTLFDAHFVSDLNNETLYFNIYCAQCNGVHDVLHWKLKASCNEPSEFDAKSEQERDKFTITNCEISSVPPTEEVGFKFLCSSDPIKSCNITGYWDFYDPELERKCLDYDILYTETNNVGFEQEYANVYCYLCNMQRGAKVYDLCENPFDENERTFLYPFTFLITTYRTQTAMIMRETRCERYEIWDQITTKCRELLCPFSYVPANGKCDPIVDSMDGMTFQIYHQYNITYEQVRDFPIEENQWLRLLTRISRLHELISHGCQLCSIQISVDSSGFIISQTIIVSTKTCSVETILFILHNSIKGGSVQFYWKSQNLGLNIKLIYGETLWENFISSIVSGQYLMCRRGRVFRPDLVFCPGVKYDVHELLSSSIANPTTNKLVARSTLISNNTYMICYNAYKNILAEINSAQRTVCVYSLVLLIEFVATVYGQFT